MSILTRIFKDLFTKADEGAIILPNLVTAKSISATVDTKTTQDISVEGLAELANYECVTLKPYLDSGGVKTVGVGSTVSDIPDLSTWDWDRTLTIKEAIDIYRNSLKKYIKGVNETLKVDIDQQLFDALVSITYNIGISGMKSSTFMRLVNASASRQRIANAMALWHKDNGKVVPGLINRRRKETDLILSGKYEANGMIPVAPVVNKKPQYSKAKMVKLADYI
jgi:lysozyme